MRLIFSVATTAALAAALAACNPSTNTTTTTNTTSTTNATANSNVATNNGQSGSAAQGANTAATANTPASSSAAQTSGEAARINVNELRDRLAKGTAVALDVRGEGQHNAGYIKDSVWIPEAEVAARAGELPRDKMIVTYCS